MRSDCQPGGFTSSTLAVESREDWRGLEVLGSPGRFLVRRCLCECELRAASGHPPIASATGCIRPPLDKSSCDKYSCD